jgi:hypothetical protein
MPFMAGPGIHDPNIISPDDIKALVDAILTHARGIQPIARRRRCAAEYILKRLVAMGETKNRTPIQAADIKKTCPGDNDATDPRAAVRGLMRDLKKALTHFFEEEPEGKKQRYRLNYFGVGNYLLVLSDTRSPVRPDDFVGHFWEPHRSLPRPAILYPEPQFFIDPKGTYIRNPGVNTPEEAAQLGIQGELKTSYSFVPSGIVHAMLRVMETLCTAQPGRNRVHPTASVIRHSTATPPPGDNLIVLATPTSATALVAKLEEGLPMRTTSTGVSLNDAADLLEDTSDVQGDCVTMVKWGVLTRRPPGFKDRALTLLAARHGRTVEAMARFLTDPKQIPALARQLQRQEFPHSFQALFRVEMTKTPDGPTIDAVHVDFAEPIEASIVPKATGASDAPTLERA